MERGDKMSHPAPAEVPKLRIQLKKVFRQPTGQPSFSLSVDTEIGPGITMLFGHSGSGKTTLLKCLAGLLQADSGRIDLSGYTLFDSGSPLNVPASQRNIGFVFQDLALFPHLSAEENIAYGLFRVPDSERRRRIDRVLDAFHIGHVKGRRPSAISGGEQQRVALARALVTEPRALLLDEPISALDPATKSLIIEDLLTWISDHQIPVLYVTHSREEVFALGQSVIAIEEGRIVASGSPREVFTGHRHESVAAWGGVENVFDGQVTAHHPHQGTMTVLTGQIELEVPLGRAAVGKQVRVGVSAGDILLASSAPQGLSARNILAGSISSISQSDVTVIIQIDCKKTIFEAHVTPGAVESLALQKGTAVWVVIKTHSCFLIER
jgi:molybdate transport system ATP-binding protein